MTETEDSRSHPDPVGHAPTWDVTALYRADITGAIGQIVGPNTLGELYVLAAVEEVPPADGTVGWRWRGRFRLALAEHLEATGGVVAGRMVGLGS